MNLFSALQFAAGLALLGVAAIFLAFAIGAALVILAGFRAEANRIEREGPRR